MYSPPETPANGGGRWPGGGRVGGARELASASSSTTSRASLGAESSLERLSFGLTRAERALSTILSTAWSSARGGASADSPRLARRTRKKVCCSCTNRKSSLALGSTPSWDDTSNSRIKWARMRPGSEALWLSAQAATRPPTGWLGGEAVSVSGSSAPDVLTILQRWSMRPSLVEAGELCSCAATRLFTAADRSPSVGGDATLSPVAFEAPCTP
mmetsp:Transcript_25174/g.76397  ORF Transcript_25174/g.76397 Transcript_25174/m.76397 type:complete len:214 (-) Transcript_25174:408-1049(-)|eukprot:scaffold290905_cov28-Tisochrysis_lutea.AAC.3